MRAGLGRLFLAGLLALLACPAPARGEDPPGDAAGFAKNMKRLEGYLDRERFAKGLEEMAKVLAKHGQQPYVRARRWELADLAERFAFGAAYPPVRAGAVMQGRVHEWDPDRGYLQISWTREQAGALKRIRGDRLQLPFDTRGPYVLGVSARSMPSRSGGTAFVEISGGPHPKTSKPQFWHVHFGSPDKLAGAKTVYRPAVIEHIDGGKRRTVSTSHAIPGKVGRPYRAQVKVGTTSITAGVSGKIVGRAKKHKGMWGWVRFGIPSWSKAEFSGYIEPAYVQDRIDLVVQKQLLAFRKTFRKEDVLPAWLFEKPAKPLVVSRRDLPVDLETKHWSHVRLFHQHMKARTWAPARAQLTVLEKQGVPEPVVAYLAARMRLETGEAQQGLADVERCLGAAPDFLEGLLLKGVLQSRMRRAEAAATTFREALAKHPGDPHAYETSVHALIAAGRPDAAQAIAEVAAHRDILTPELDKLSRVLVKAIKGPPWSRVYEYKSRNYHVMSDIGKRVCVEASKVLEEALTLYKVRFHWVARDKTRLFKVYVFRGRFGFDHYMVDLDRWYGLPGALTAGVYHAQLKQLLVRDLHDRDEMMRTVRHEGFHQYLDRFVPDAPRWLNEGLAVYHELASRRRGRLTFGENHPIAQKVLKEKGWIPLATYLFEDPLAYYQRGFHSYAQGWVLAHMLMKGKPRWRALFKAIVEDLQTMAGRDVLAKHFPPDVLKAFEADALAHRNKIAKTR